ncbi:growth hormone receptor-like [Brachionichthys hirsutus]|uniref:growth hormone receptor-like n=1 Tax=Brachionichthys hirsutus TaxID=412623 RepID=UPI0036049B44
MAAPSPSRLVLLLISSLGWLSTPGFAFLMNWDQMTTTAPSEPHFTQCLSRDQATFRCWWSPGNVTDLSEPGALRVFFLKKDSPTSKWRECPEYIHSRRECFFDVNHTSVWVTYCMQLRGRNNVTYFGEDDCFRLENIVRPDPPVSLNWTLLNISPSGLSYDVMVSWKPPPTADVRTGWMRVEYEIQYRERNATTSWEALEMQPHTMQTIYGLQIGLEYEVHIHCRMLAFTKFGEFSESIFIQVTDVPSKESDFPFTLVLAFGVMGMIMLIILIFVSQQHRLMMILLPPVPAPKIKGIDSDLLKKGKLNEVNFILSGGDIPRYAPDFYQDEPWVEFIEVDADAGEKDENQGSDTQRLLGLPQPVSRHLNTGSSDAISFPNGDSDQASCHDPDLADQDTMMLMSTLLPGQPELRDSSFDFAERSPSPDGGNGPLIQTQTAGPQTWVNTDFYAQVSNVMPSGGVVLSPGQQLRRESTSATEEETQKKAKEPTEEKKKKKQKELHFQLLVVDPEEGSYTTESTVQQISTPPSAPIPGEGYQTIHPDPVETKPTATPEDNQSPYVLPDFPQPQLFAPVADYTVVQEVDSQHSLLLNPPPHQSPPPCQPQHPLKTLPAMPVGYITPDLLGNLSP